MKLVNRLVQIGQIVIIAVVLIEILFLFYLIGEMVIDAIRCTCHGSSALYLFMAA